MNSDAFTVEQLARIEQGDAWGAQRKAPHYPETIASFKLVNFDIDLALTELDDAAADARKLRNERDVLQGAYLAAADDVQLNTQLARALIRQLEGTIGRVLKNDPALGRKLRTRIPEVSPGESIRDVRDALNNRVGQLADTVTDVTSIGLQSSFLVEAAVVEDNFVVLVDGAVVKSSARVNHTRKLHAALNRLGALITSIESVCVQMETTPTLGRRPPAFDQGILLAAAAGHAPRPQAETLNTAGLPPLAPEGNAETSLPPLAPAEEA